MKHGHQSIQFKVDKALTTLEDVRLLVANRSWTSAANRLYYACFYMASAVLLTQNLRSKTHTGTKLLFQQHFVKIGSMEPKVAEVYQQVFDLRNEGDYGDFAILTEADVVPLLLPAETFINDLKNLIERL